MKLLSYTSFQNLRIALVCAFVSLIIVACKKDTPVEIKDLIFPSDTYYVSEGGELSLYINSGNQKYSLSLSDKGLIETSINATDWPAGNIQVKGLKKGSAQLTVKDEVTGQEVALQIHVVDPYLALKAIYLIPHIKGADYSTDTSIRNKVRNEPKTFAAFEEGEVLILQRNANHQFSVFKNEEDVAKGTVHRSGTYALSFSFGGPNRLTLHYADSEEIVEFPLFTPNGQTFSELLDFAGEGRLAAKQIRASSITLTQSVYGSNAGSKLSTSPTTDYPQLYLIEDFTQYFQAIHPNVERVELFQGMRPYPAYHHLNFGEGILK